MEIANIKSVNSDIAQDVAALPRPPHNGQNRAEDGGAIHVRGQEAGRTQRQGHGLVGALRTVWERWKHLARKIGDFQARALMTVFYFVILAPAALILRWRSDPLAIKAGASRGWTALREREGAPMEQARRQF